MSLCVILVRSQHIFAGESRDVSSAESDRSHLRWRIFILGKHRDMVNRRKKAYNGLQTLVTIANNPMFIRLYFVLIKMSFYYERTNLSIILYNFSYEKSPLLSSVTTTRLLYMYTCAFQ